MLGTVSPILLNLTRPQHLMTEAPDIGPGPARSSPPVNPVCFSDGKRHGYPSRYHALVSAPPDGDGWVPWPEDETGTPRSPDLGELEEGETIESRYHYGDDRLIGNTWSERRYEYGGDRLIEKAWSRKVKLADSDG